MQLAQLGTTQPNTPAEMHHTDGDMSQGHPQKTHQWIDVAGAAFQYSSPSSLQGATLQDPLKTQMVQNSDFPLHFPPHKLGCFL